jgi:outer membrane protein
MKRVFLSCICFFAVLGMALPAAAVELGVRGYYWFPELSGDMRVDDAGIVGTTIDLEKDLGIDDESYPVVEVFAGIGKHHLSLVYYNLDVDGDTVLSRDITFNGEDFRFSERVTSNLEYDHYDIMYRYDLIDLENFLAGGSLGLVARVMIFDGSAAITSATVTAKEDFTVPIPMLGANFHVGILKDILEARVLVTGIGYSDSTAFDGQAEVSVTPFPFLDIHGGYRFFIIDVDEDDVLFDFDNSGPYVALTVSF